MSNDVKSTPNAAPPKPAEKLSIDADSLKAALAEALKQGIAEGMAMSAIANKNNAPVNPRLANIARVSDPCPDCRQEKTACKGEHADVIVHPRDDRWARYFQGVWINGVLYRSNDANHRIKVPASAGIEQLVRNWENNEIEVSSGRKRQHVTGNVYAPNTNVPYFR